MNLVCFDMPAITGQAVSMVKEPSNEYDPDAVSVRLLDGTSLGYVPRYERLLLI